MNGKFAKELQELINRHSIENDSNTPDFILTEFVCDVLEAFSRALKKRESWYNRKDRPGLTKEEIDASLKEGAEQARLHREATPPPKMNGLRYRGGC